MYQAQDNRSPSHTRLLTTLIGTASIGLLALACQGDPTLNAPTEGAMPMRTIAPANCAIRGTLVGMDNFTARYGCGATIRLVAGSGASLSELSGVAEQWNDVTNPTVSGVPRLTTDVPPAGTSWPTFTVVVSGSAPYAGQVVFSTSTINIGHSTATNAASSFNILLHEMSHVFGFTDKWDGAYAVAGVSDHCARHSANAPTNSTTCQHEGEDLLYAYSQAATPSDLSKHIVTGFDVSPASTSQVVGTQWSASVDGLTFSHGNPSICGSQLVRAMASAGPQLTGCTQPDLSGLTYHWTTSDAGVVSLAQAYGTGNTLTAAGVGQATITVTIDDFGTYQGGTFFTDAGHNLTFPVTVTAPTVTSVSATGGNGQTGPVHQTLSIPLKVKAVSSTGAGVPGVSVTFAVLTGGGSIVAPTSVTTNAQGEASANWTLGNTAGTQTAKATVAGSGITGNPVTFTATATAGPAAAIVIIDGDGQTATRGSALPVNPTVRVQDAYGNVVAGNQVSFAVTLGGGSVSPTTATTDVQGLAATVWTLGSTVGEQDMSATATGVANPASFTATSVRTFPLANFAVQSCSSYTSGAKTYNDFTVGWSGGSGSWEIGEATTNNSGSAVVIKSGSGTTSAVLGSYLASGTPNYRYWWIRNTGTTTWVALTGNPTNVARCLL